MKQNNYAASDVFQRMFDSVPTLRYLLQRTTS